jgi:hypothetical protein
MTVARSRIQQKQQTKRQIEKMKLTKCLKNVKITLPKIGE